MADTSANNYLVVKGSFFCVVKAPATGWLGVSKEKGTPFIRIPVVVQDGPQEGKEITYNAYLSDAAFDRSIQTLAEVFGFDGDLDGLQNGTVSFAGMECRITTEFEEYQGKERLRVAWLNPAQGGQLAAETAAPIISKLQSRAKALAAAANKGRPAPASPATGGKGTPF